MSGNPCAELEEELAQLQEKLKEAEKSKEAIQAVNLEQGPPIEVTPELIQRGTEEYDSLVYRIPGVKARLDKCREEYGEVG